MKKLLCILLAGLMLVGTVSCATTDEVPEDTRAESAASTDASTGDATAESEAVTEDQSYICDLPADYKVEGKKDISIIYTKNDYTADQLVASEAGGVVSDAVHERNVATEEQLGVTLTLFAEDTSVNVNRKVNQDIMSGDGAYELVCVGTSSAVMTVVEGRYINLSALSNIDTSKHYWTQGYNDMVTLTDRNMQFLASGPLAITMFRLMYLTLYNKALLEDYQIPDLYDSVRDGTWTLDYQYSLITDKHLDKDGDNTPGEGDFYGFVTGNIISVDPYMVATDIHLIAKNPETGDFYFDSENLLRLSNLCDKVQRIYNDQGTYVYKGATLDDVPKTNIITHFNEERAMMITTMFWQMEHNFNALSNLTYGIAPIPKYDELQEDYHSYVQDQVSCFGISAAIASPDRQNELAAVLEVLAYHSYHIVRPAYYETALSERYMQDPQSSEVLDLIFDTLDFDFSSSCSNIFDNPIRDSLRSLLSGDSNTISSSTKSWERSYNRQLEKDINPKLDKLKSSN